MGVNLTKEVKGELAKAIKGAEEAASAAAEAGPAEPEAEKTDCDSVKEKNAQKFTQIFQDFINENKGDIQAILKIIDPNIKDISDKLTKKKIIEQRWFSRGATVSNFEKRVAEYVSPGLKCYPYFREDLDKFFLDDSPEASAPPKAQAEPSAEELVPDPGGAEPAGAEGGPPGAAPPAGAEGGPSPGVAPKSGGGPKDAPKDAPKDDKPADGAADGAADGDKPKEDGKEGAPDGDKPKEGEAPAEKKEDEYTSKYGIILTKFIKDKKSLTPEESKDFFKQIIEHYIIALRYGSCQEVLAYIVDSKPFKSLIGKEVKELKDQVKSGNMTASEATDAAAAKTAERQANAAPPPQGGGEESVTDDSSDDGQSDGGSLSGGKSEAKKAAKAFKKEQKANNYKNLLYYQ